MCITHLILIPTQESGLGKILKWAKVIKPESNPSPSDPVQISLLYLWHMNNSLGIILWPNLPT